MDGYKYIQRARRRPSVDHCCYIAQEDKTPTKQEKMGSKNSEKNYFNLTD